MQCSPQRSLAGDLFAFERGEPVLTKAADESTIYKNVFLVGPHVRHDKAVFCFIYKYRQRFAVVAKAILKRIGRDPPPVIATYAARGFLLEDLTCCADECKC